MEQKNRRLKNSRREVDVNSSGAGGRESQLTSDSSFSSARSMAVLPSFCGGKTTKRADKECEQT